MKCDNTELVGEDAFAGCSKLKSLKFNKIPEIGDNGLIECNLDYIQFGTQIIDFRKYLKLDSKELC